MKEIYPLPGVLPCRVAAPENPLDNPAKTRIVKKERFQHRMTNERKRGAVNRLTRRMANLRLRTKFLLILILAIAVVGVTALTTVRLPYSAYDEQLYRASAQMMTLFTNQIQAELEDIEELSYRILSDSALQESLSVMKAKSPGSVAWVEARTEVANRISSIGLWFTSAVSVQLKTPSGASFNQFYATSITADELTPDRLAAAQDNSGRAVWLTEEGTPPRLFLLREIREIRGMTLDTLATLLIEVNVPGLVEKYRAGMAQLGYPLSCAVYRGDIRLYASDPEVGALDTGEDGYSVMRLDGQESLCVSYTSPQGLKYVALVDYSAINKDVSAASRYMAGIIVITLILVLAFSGAMMSGILRHLKALLEKFDAFAISGHPVPENDNPYDGRQDEIGQLHRHFDKMTRDWDRMIRDKEEQQRLLQEKQMQQLRAQVRPHFLYNTLESIYCLAKNCGDERIATMTDALGKMLRASLNDKRDVVTVAEDLQITQAYLRIQLIRYGDRLRVEYDLPEDILACRIPAMTLQPLVENAVHHAAEEMLDTCVIRISGEAVDGGIDVVVEDNGPGMDEDILAKLESGEIKPAGMGIGMRNIHRRVQYAFSQRYGLQVRRVDAHTRIIIHLPDTRPRK